MKKEIVKHLIMSFLTDMGTVAQLQTIRSVLTELVNNDEFWQRAELHVETGKKHTSEFLKKVTGW